MPHFGNYDPATFGWSVLPDRADIVKFTVAGVPFPGGVHKAVRPLFTLMLADMLPHIPGGLDNPGCWGYAYRPITGSSTQLSFHAYGLALDINAPENGYSAGTRIPPHTLGPVIGDIARKYGCEWGGAWSEPHDMMHVECHLAPDEIPGVIAQVSKHPVHLGGVVYGDFRHVLPGSRRLFGGCAGTDVKFVQRWIGRLTVDGLFGPATSRMVTWYQGMEGLTQDGIVGPRTWDRMGVRYTGR